MSATYANIYSAEPQDASVGKAFETALSKLRSGVFLECEHHIGGERSREGKRTGRG